MSINELYSCGNLLGSIKNEPKIEVTIGEGGNYFELKGNMVLDTWHGEYEITFDHERLMKCLNSDLFMGVNCNLFICHCNSNGINELLDICRSPINEIGWWQIPEPTEQDLEIEAVINEIEEENICDE